MIKSISAFTLAVTLLKNTLNLLKCTEDSVFLFLRHCYVQFSLFLSNSFFLIHMQTNCVLCQYVSLRTLECSCCNSKLFLVITRCIPAYHVHDTTVSHCSDSLSLTQVFLWARSVTGWLFCTCPVKTTSRRCVLIVQLLVRLSSLESQRSCASLQGDAVLHCSHAIELVTKLSWMARKVNYVNVSPGR